MTQAAAHLTDAELADFDGDGSPNNVLVRAHLQTCDGCARRYDEMKRLRELLAVTGQRERRPLRDVVPSAMMRLRLRRNTVTNANELFESFAALVRGVISLFSLPIADLRDADGTHGGPKDRHE
jgi:predicted anti-sigma-YlaC factor YlaD